MTLEIQFVVFWVMTTYNLAVTDTNEERAPSVLRYVDNSLPDNMLP
jgi:hypothetical protein